MVQQLFRKGNGVSYSIEKVFDTIFPFLQEELPIQRQFAVSRSAGICSVVNNLLGFKRKPGSVYHITGDIHYAALAFPSKRTIVTIHDCVFLENNTGIKRWILKKIWLDLPVRHAGCITTISEKSKQEIVRFTGCSASKIVVIPNPVSTSIQSSNKCFNSELPVILFVGTKSNKNLSATVSALKGIPCVLHIVGKLSQKQIEELRSGDINFKEFYQLSDQQMAEQYAQCDLLLFPSIYEGFGLPIIEAQFAGRPIITSNISPMKEVAGGGACLVDPYDVSSIRDGIRKVIEDAKFRNLIVGAGKINVQKYQPERIATLYKDIYLKFLSKDQGNGA